MPNYTEKLMNPLSDQAFLEGMKTGPFIRVPEHPGLIAFLHYSAARISEALSMRRRNFRMTPATLYVDIELRLKGSQKTDPLPIPLEAPHVDCIVDSFRRLKPEGLVWPYCRKTGYNIVHRVFEYPHYHRLSRITWFFQAHPELNRPHGFSVAEVRSWTGLSLKALNYYLGLVAIDDMGRALVPGGP